MEQTETPEQLDLRRKENGSKDKVIERTVLLVLQNKISPATRRKTSLLYHDV